MGNVIVSFPNYADATVSATPAMYSGSPAFGSWETSLPESNVLTRYLSEVARSTDATNASTKFRVDLGAIRNVDVIAIPNSNITTAGRVKVTGYSDAAYSDVVVTTGWVDYWADFYAWGSRPWGSEGLFSAKITDEDAAGFPATWYYVLPSATNARYWQFEFDDTANSDGYVEISRIFLGQAWQAQINPLVGDIDLNWETRSQVNYSLGGVKFVNEQSAYRTLVARYSHIGQAEAFGQPFSIATKVGLSGQVFFITDPDDTELQMQRAFLATMTELPGLNFASESETTLYSTVVQIEEVR